MAARFHLGLIVRFHHIHDVVAAQRHVAVLPGDARTAPADLLRDAIGQLPEFGRIFEGVRSQPREDQIGRHGASTGLIGRFRCNRQRRALQTLHRGDILPERNCLPATRFPGYPDRYSMNNPQRRDAALLLQADWHKTHSGKRALQARSQSATKRHAASISSATGASVAYPLVPVRQATAPLRKNRRSADRHRPPRVRNPSPPRAGTTPAGCSRGRPHRR